MPGDAVQTRFGKGCVREVRNHGRLLVDVGGRALVLDGSTVSPLEAGARRSAPGRAAGVGAPAPLVTSTRSRTAAVDVDLHGLTVAEALAKAEQALNDALLADLPELRLIHGRSGGRIRAALHRRLRDIPSIRAFQLDPVNEGITVVRL